MTDAHKDAREALARIVAIEGVTDGPRTVINADLRNKKFRQVAWPFTFASPVTEGDVYHVAACDPTTMRAIAALVEEQDGKIAALTSHLQRVLLICEGVPLNAIEASQWVKDARMAANNTAQSAAAHDARIRAEVLKECAKHVWPHGDDYCPVKDDKVSRDAVCPTCGASSGDICARSIAAALRTMGGDDE